VKDRKKGEHVGRRKNCIENVSSHEEHLNLSQMRSRNFGKAPKGAFYHDKKKRRPPIGGRAFFGLFFTKKNLCRNPRGS